MTLPGIQFWSDSLPPDCGRQLVGRREQRPHPSAASLTWCRCRSMTCTMFGIPARSWPKGQRSSKREVRAMKQALLALWSCLGCWSRPMP